MNLTETRAKPLHRRDPGWIGPYRLLGRLGAGGMGVVFLAQTPHGGLVAVKVIHHNLASDESFHSRFRGEVARVRQVPPFCTAEILDADPDHDPPYLVVEFIDGPSLADDVGEYGPLSPANVHAVAVGVATALSAIHGAGVVHRDLKPQNVLLAPGSPKVIDFGLAKALEAPATGHTASGQMFGTLEFMAPERLDGSESGGSPGADIFSWGAVVVYAATGRVPFRGATSHQVAASILSAEPNLTGVPAELQEPVRLSLLKRPEDRPTARELLDYLLSNTPERAPAKTRRSTRRHLLTATVLTAAVVLIATIALVYPGPLTSWWEGRHRAAAQSPGYPTIVDISDPTGDDNGPGSYRYPTAAEFRAGSSTSPTSEWWTWATSSRSRCRLAI